MGRKEKRRAARRTKKQIKQQQQVRQVRKTRGGKRTNPKLMMGGFLVLGLVASWVYLTQGRNKERVWSAEHGHFHTLDADGNVIGEEPSLGAAAVADAEGSVRRASVVDVELTQALRNVAFGRGPPLSGRGGELGKDARVSPVSFPGWYNAPVVDFGPGVGGARAYWG